MNVESKLRRFEQQLSAFESMHADELKGFQAKLESFIRLQADEIKFLREELAALKAELAAREQEPTVDTQNQAQPSINKAVEPETRLNRRQFLSGGLSRHQS